LESALGKAGVSPEVSTQIVDENEKARIDGLRAALAVLAVFAVIAMFFVGRIPKQEPGAVAVTGAAGPTGGEPAIDTT
jgi:hypothetical protein